MSTGGKLLGFKEQPGPTVVAVPRVDGVGVEGEPHVDPLPTSQKSRSCSTGPEVEGGGWLTSLTGSIKRLATWLGMGGLTW